MIDAPILAGAPDGDTIRLLNAVGEALTEAGATLSSALLDRIAALLGVDALAVWITRDGALRREAAGSAHAAWDAAAAPAPTVAQPDCLAVPLADGPGPPRGWLRVFADPARLAVLAASPALTQSLGGQFALFLSRRELAADAVLLREVHHRVKNNLQTVMSLLRMQRRRLADRAAQDAIGGAIGRIGAIAHVHDALARTAGGGVGLRALAEEIAGLVVRDIAGRDDVRIEAEGPDPRLEAAQATPVALIANELVQNALDHSLRDPAVLRITTRVEQGRATLSVADGGRLPPGPAMAPHLGLTIVRLLAEEELRGAFELACGADGTIATIDFPVTSSRP